MQLFGRARVRPPASNHDWSATHIISRAAQASKRRADSRNANISDDGSAADVLSVHILLADGHFTRYLINIQTTGVGQVATISLTFQISRLPPLLTGQDQLHDCFSIKISLSVKLRCAGSAVSRLSENVPSHRRYCPLRPQSCPPCILKLSVGGSAVMLE